MPVGESPDAETTSRRSAAKSRRQDDHKPTNVNIELIVIGKTDSKEIESLLAMYARRINFYCRFAVTVLPDVKNTKNLSAKQQRTTEGASLLRQFGDGDYVVLLDERGDEYRSIDFAYWLQKRMASGIRRLVMVIGGPYGFSDEVYRRADAKLSSKFPMPSERRNSALVLSPICALVTNGSTSLIRSSLVSTAMT